MFGLNGDSIESLARLKILDVTDTRTYWRFVGFIRTTADLIAVVPKPIEADYKGVALMRSALNRYFNSGATRVPQRIAVEDLFWRDDRALQELDGASTLLRAFLDHGPYRAPSTQVARRGAVDWRRTLRGTPIHAANGSIYRELWRSRHGRDTNDVTRVLLGMLTWLLAKYPILKEPHGLADAIAECGAYSHDEIARRRQLFASLIRAERAVTYRTDQIAVLEVALALISDDRSLRGREAFALFGTRAFEYIWEDACREAMGGDDGGLRSTLAMPEWNWTNHAPTTGEGQRPDVIQQFGETVFVVDAKYYFPVPPVMTPWQDIAKQLIYAQSLPIGSDNRLRNAFVFPAAREPVEKLGEVSVDSAKEHVGKIELWSLNAWTALLRYSKRLGADSDFISRLLD